MVASTKGVPTSFAKRTAAGLPCGSQLREGGKAPLTSQAYNKSIWEMDQKANYFKSYGMWQAYADVVGLCNIPGLMWHRISFMQESAFVSAVSWLLAWWIVFFKMNNLEAPSSEEILYFYSVKANPMSTNKKNLGFFRLDKHPNSYCPICHTNRTHDLHEYLFFSSIFPTKRVLSLRLSFHLSELSCQSARIEEIVKKEAQYRAFSKEQLKPKTKNILNHDWFSCHPDPLYEEEIILKRFAAVYPDVGPPRASTSGRGDRPFRILCTPSLYRMCWGNQGGFDEYLLGINFRRYPVKDYIDKVDQIIKSPRNPGAPSDTIKVDPLMIISLPNFKEYDSLLSHGGTTAFARGQPYSISLTDSPKCKMLKSLISKISAALGKAKSTYKGGKGNIYNPRLFNLGRGKKDSTTPWEVSEVPVASGEQALKEVLPASGAIPGVVPNVGGFDDNLDGLGLPQERPP
uniref:Uncharacterized protein n=1 Tax=Cannabis sativa TaxID=3483 RepID=A0A803P4C5_CANSA